MTAFLAVLLLALAAPGVGVAQDGDSAAFDRIGSCLADEGHLIMLAVVDESASLQRTDPDGVRVNALETVVRNMGELAARSVDTLVIELAFGAFATDYTQITDWRPVEESSTPELTAAARSFADRASGIDTDFAMAFMGAADALDARAQELASEGIVACQVLLTFTDGEYDLEPRAREVPYAPGVPLDQPGAPAEVEEAGRRLLCDPQGVMDRIYASGAVTLTVGLGSAIDPADQAFLDNLSTGRGCGSTAAEGQGAWISAGDLTGLVFAFDAASIGIAGGQLTSDTEVVPCVIETCPSGTVTFDLDETLSRFHLLISAPAPLVASLQGPEGDQLDLQTAQTAELSGAQLSLVRLGEVTVVDGELPLPATWAGTWTVTFIDPTGDNEGLLARAHIVLFGGLLPQIVDGLEGRAGEPLTLYVESVGEDGAPRIPEGFLTQVQIGVRVLDRIDDREIPVEPGPPEDGRWPFTLQIPPDTSSTSLDVIATLDATTATGTQLPQTSDRAAIAVLPPASYPRVETSDVVFDTIPGSGAATADLVIVGGADPGCVVIGPAQLEDADLGDIEVSLPGVEQGECVAVPPGERVVVEVQLERSGNQSGTLSGAIPVRLRSEVDAEEIPQQVPLTAEFATVVDQTKRLEIFVAAFGLGLLLPLLVLQVLNRLGAKFRRPAHHRVAAVDVRVTPSGTIERREGSSWGLFQLDTDDFRQVDVPPGDLRTFTCEGVDFAVRHSWAPWRAPRGLATSTTGCTGPLGHVTRGGAFAAVTPLSLSGHWVFVPQRTLDADEDAGRRGSLLLLVNDVLPFTTIQGALERSVKQTLPGAVHQLPAEAFRAEPSSHDGHGGPDAAAPSAQTHESGGGADAWQPVTGGEEDERPAPVWAGALPLPEPDEPPDEPRRRGRWRRRRSADVDASWSTDSADWAPSDGWPTEPPADDR